MGNSLSDQHLGIHRFLGRAVCQSFSANPRNLEHYYYSYWTADLTAHIVRKGLQDTLSHSSATPAPDGQTKGVYVDIAITLPLVEPRKEDELGRYRRVATGHTIANFLASFLSAQSTPRFVQIIGLLAPLLVEFKPGPNRHPAGLEQFLSSLTGLLRSGTLQAYTQAICLFLSTQYVTQTKVVMIAAAGDYDRIRHLTRASAGGQRFSSDTLRELKSAAEESHA